MHARINTIVRTRVILRNYLSREPTIDEIAVATSLTHQEVKFAMDKDSMKTVPEDTLDWAYQSNEGIEKVMRAAEMENVRREIDDLFEELEPIQRQVLIHRFGLDNGEPRTIQKIGDVLGISTDAVQKIQTRALRKMRHPNQLWRVKKLTTCVNEYFE
jgi:RNA polymerase primary sigma factor